MAYVNGDDDFLVVLKGDQGIQGDSVFIRYSANADGTGFTEIWSEGQNYIGFATGQTAPTDKSDYTWFLLGGGGGPSDVTVVQTTGDSETAVMSQKAVTTELNKKISATIDGEILVLSI